MKYQKIYEELKKEYTDKEIVDSMLLPADLTKLEKKKLSSEMKEIRLNKLRETTEEQQVIADVMRLRFQIENYTMKSVFSFKNTFGIYLKEYIRIAKKSRREFSEDLAIHYTKLSRILNEKEEANIGFCYRLEKHSGNLIKAELWWKLIVLKQSFIISKDEKTRKDEYKKVKNVLRA